MPNLSIFFDGACGTWNANHSAGKSRQGETVLADMKNHSAEAENSSAADSADVLELAVVIRELPSMTPNRVGEPGKDRRGNVVHVLKLPGLHQRN